jgi:hypothetical protein
LLHHQLHLILNLDICLIFLLPSLTLQSTNRELLQLSLKHLTSAIIEKKLDYILKIQFYIPVVHFVYYIPCILSCWKLLMGHHVNSICDSKTTLQIQYGYSPNICVMNFILFCEIIHCTMWTGSTFCILYPYSTSKTHYGHFSNTLFRNKWGRGSGYN